MMVLEGNNLTMCASFRDTPLDRDVPMQFSLQPVTALGKWYILVLHGLYSVLFKLCFVEGVDFEALDPSELTQTFPAGLENGTLCLTTLAMPDDVIESPEVFRVLLNSSDPAVTITRDSVQVTIGDANIGKCTSH